MINIITEGDGMRIQADNCIVSLVLTGNNRLDIQHLVKALHDIPVDDWVGIQVDTFVEFDERKWYLKYARPWGTANAYATIACPGCGKVTVFHALEGFPTVDRLCCPGHWLVKWAPRHDNRCLNPHCGCMTDGGAPFCGSCFERIPKTIATELCYSAPETPRYKHAVAYAIKELS